MKKASTQVFMNSEKQNKFRQDLCRTHAQFININGTPNTSLLRLSAIGTWSLWSHRLFTLRMLTSLAWLWKITRACASMCSTSAFSLGVRDYHCFFYSRTWNCYQLPTTDAKWESYSNWHLWKLLTKMNPSAARRVHIINHKGQIPYVSPAWVRNEGLSYWRQTIYKQRNERYFCWGRLTRTSRFLQECGHVSNVREVNIRIN